VRFPAAVRIAACRKLKQNHKRKVKEMKTKMIGVVVSLLVTVCAHARFTYDATSGTVTDASCGWTFKATCKNTDELTLDGTGCSFSGTAGCSLDLTEIYSADGTTRYRAVSFKALPAAARPYITAFIAPDCQQIQGENCFYNCTALTTVNLNATVTFIGASSFRSCSNLANFSPRTLDITYAYGSTFNSCASLEGGFTLPSCQKLLNGSFSSCTMLEWISAPTVTEIGESCFFGCSSLSTVSFPNVLRIANQAFQNCTSLSTESVNGLLHSAVERLGSNDIANQKALFANCTAIKGPINWNLPSLTTNVVADSMFYGCSALEEVRIVSDVAEIKTSAFNNIAPGASVYMPLKAPAVYGANAVARSSAPYPKVYLNGNFEDWFAVMRDKHQVLPKERFNDTTWAPTTTTTTRAIILSRMSADTEMCTATKTGGTITKIEAKDKNVIAFVAYNDASYCWVLKTPTSGLVVIVR
jgi:hypothetical protein